MEGEYLQYDENGTLKTRASYVGGELSGTYETYNEDGSCRMVEYRAGLSVHDYYSLTNSSGNTLRFHIAYRCFAQSCARLPVLPARSPHLLARQYKDSYFGRKIQMRKNFGMRMD